MKKIIFIMILMAFMTATSYAKNIDLVTLPSRNTVQLTIYNSADITLVKETRQLTLKKGANPLQFSWANTLIDPSSVEIRPLDHKGDIEVLDTIFPGQKPQHLIWNIDSKYEGQVTVEVSYFTSGLTWTMDYVAITDPAEEKMKFRGFVRVFNNSGEEYENSEVRLIVGKINLVEKIAELAKRRGMPTPKPASKDYSQMRSKAAKRSFAMAEMAEMDDMMGGAAYESAPKGIVKESFSEYFMFTVDGTETIKNGWSKRMRAVKADGVKFDILYRMRAHQYGPRPVRFFIWKNDEDHELGDAPLPDGLVRVFRENGKEGLSFLGEQKVNYAPIQAKIEINLGTDDLVVYECKKNNLKRFNFSFNKHSNVDGWDEEQEWADQVRNYRTKSITFELRKIINGDIEYNAKKNAKKFDYRTVETTFSVSKRDVEENPYTVISHFGTNKKQDRIKIK